MRQDGGGGEEEDEILEELFERRGGEDEGKEKGDEDRAFECRVCNEDSDAEEGMTARPAMTPYQPGKKEVKSTS